MAQPKQCHVRQQQHYCAINSYTTYFLTFISHTSFFAFSCHQTAFGYRLLSHCVKHLYCREKCSTSKHSCNSNTIFLLRKKKKKFSPIRSFPFSVPCILCHHHTTVTYHSSICLDRILAAHLQIHEE